MLSKPRLTFVLPCYNVESVVQQCIDSVYSCDLSSDQFEVLCIDDCSPDNTIQILQRNLEEHSNFRIISHTENRGLGGARNTGLREAQGTYVWFIDSDDILSPNNLVDLVRKAEVDNLDVLCFNYRRVDNEGHILSTPLVFRNISVQDGSSFVDSAFGGGFVSHLGYVWRFLYRTEFLRSNQISFPEKVYWEDTVFMPRAILMAQRVASVPDVLYSYRVNPESISGSFSRAYPAKMIIDLSFVCGRDLLCFSNELDNSCPCKGAIWKVAINKYINGFPIYLFRTSSKERHSFYQIVSSVDYSDISGYFFKLSRILLTPVIGPVLAGILSIAYKIKHR